MAKKKAKVDKEVTWDDAIKAFKKSKGNGKVARLPKYSPENEPFDAEFRRLVIMKLRKNTKRWINIYKGIDGQELMAARYRIAMALPHNGGRVALAEKYAQMEFLYGIFHYIERRNDIG